MNVFPTKYTYVVLMIFLSLTSYLSAQENTTSNCGTITTPESIEYYNSLKSQIKKYEQEFMLKKYSKSKSVKVINSIPIKAHIIRNSNGSGGLSVSELDHAIAEINSIYADAYMEFFLCDGINYINDDKLCHFKKGDESSLTETNNVPGLINIYFTDYIENNEEESICGYSDNVARNDVIVMKSSCATNNSSLAHELGHFFSLMHTHGTGQTTTELVDGSNCDTDGDGICDTPADPGLTDANVNNFCEYTGCETDANGDKYVPDANNIMSYSRKACRNYFTPQQLARMYAFYLTTKNYFSCPSFNSDFTVDASQTCNESLTVNFTNQCSDVTQWEWDVDSDGTIDYTTQNPTHNFNTGIYDVTLKVSNELKTITKTYSNYIKVGTETTFLDEDFNDFETAGDHGWTNLDTSSHGYNWMVNSGDTPSENTGPKIDDYNSDNKLNKYIYTEASGAKPGDVAEFITPCIDVANQNSELEFSYHMFGNNIGELHIDIKTESGYIYDVIEPIIGNQQTHQDDAFLIKNIDLSAYANQTIKVVFRAIRGANWDGDIAIDNIFIKTIDVPISDDPTKVYPNPVSGNQLYVKTINSKDLLTTFQISNFEGKVFLSGTLTNQPINVSSLSSGMYLITISNAQSKVVKKIIK